MKDYVDAFTHRKPNWPLAGYAPGGYLGKCRDCGVDMADVDKRASQCFPCAVDAANETMEKQRVRVRELEAQLETVKAAIQIVQPA